jgi:hypothetical protein
VVTSVLQEFGNSDNYPGSEKYPIKEKEELMEQSPFALDKQPSEILIVILSWVDKWKTCSLVCKRWRRLYRDRQIPMETWISLSYQAPFRILENPVRILVMLNLLRDGVIVKRLVGSVWTELKACSFDVLFGNEQDIVLMPCSDNLSYQKDFLEVLAIYFGWKEEGPEKWRLTVVQFVHFMTRGNIASRSSIQQIVAPLPGTEINRDAVKALEALPVGDLFFGLGFEDDAGCKQVIRSIWQFGCITLDHRPKSSERVNNEISRLNKDPQKIEQALKIVLSFWGPM